jgi:hypothetical protein
VQSIFVFTVARHAKLTVPRLESGATTAPARSFVCINAHSALAMD